MKCKQGRTADPSDFALSAFTLVELLAILVIISMVVLMCLPAQAKVRQRVQQSSCFNNFRQLQLSWLVYNNSSGDRLVPNSASGTGFSRAAVWADPQAWVQGNAYIDLNTTNIESGALYPYSHSTAIYKCPADGSTVRDQGLVPRSRSVSMSLYMNSAPVSTQGFYPYCWHALSQVAAPSKATVFLDEHENSISTGCFYLNHPNSFRCFGFPLWTWANFPATRHNNGCTLSFADGHVETWHWKEPNTLAISARSPWLYGSPAVTNDRDLQRLFGALPDHVPF